MARNIQDPAETEVPKVWVEPVGRRGPDPYGPFDDEVDASIFMDEHGLSDEQWKLRWR